MDTATVIVALFIISILSASLTSSPGTKIAISSPVTLAPTGVGVDRELTLMIKKFILAYRNRVEDGVAEAIARGVVKYGGELGVDPRLVTALLAVESAFNPRDVSSSGAQGLGQLMPATAVGLGVTDSFDIEQNIRGTTRYIKMMLERWAGNPEQVTFALASYKDGYGAVSRANGNLSEDTRRYVARILELRGSI